MSGVRSQLTITPHDPMPTSHRATPTPPSLPPGSSAGTCQRLVVHVTPLRCSRALALRHLAARYRHPLGPSWVVLGFTGHATATPSSLSSSPSSTPAPATAATAPARAGSASGAGSTTGAVPGSTAVLAASDAEDLVGGLQRVLLVPRALAASAAAAAITADGTADAARTGSSAAAVGQDGSSGASQAGQAVTHPADLAFPVDLAALGARAVTVTELGQAVTSVAVDGSSDEPVWGKTRILVVKE